MKINFDFLATDFLSNQISDYLLAVVIFIAGILLIKILRKLAFRNLKNGLPKQKMSTTMQLLG